MVSQIEMKIKRNRFLKGLYCLWRDYNGYSRKSFGYIGRFNISPPIKISRPENMFLMGNNSVRDAVILNLSAKFIIGMVLEQQKV